MAKTNAARELQLELLSALMRTGQIDPVNVEIRGNKAEAMCREVPGRGQMWLKTVNGLLAEPTSEDQVPFHLCRRYVLKNGKMVFGWHIGIEANTAKGLKKEIDWFCTALTRVLSGQGTFVPAPAPAAPQPPPSSIKPAGTVIDPNFADDMDVRREAAMARTTASPRMPEYSPDPPSSAAKPRMTTIQSGTMVDSRNKTVPVIIQEMPLPFTYTDDMNKPNEKGRGAKGKGA
jgi:hypothetical protein